MTLQSWLSGTPASDLDEDALRSEVHDMKQTIAHVATDIKALVDTHNDMAKELAARPTRNTWRGGMEAGEHMARQATATVLGHVYNRLQLLIMGAR